MVTRDARLGFFAPFAISATYTLDSSVATARQSASSASFVELLAAVQEKM
jgi:hypothetical protein